MVTLRSHAVKKDANDNTDVLETKDKKNEAKDGKKEVKDRTTIVVFVGLLIDLLGRTSFSNVEEKIELRGLGSNLN